MADPPEHPAPIGGSCLCGAVRVTLEAARAAIEVCHCTMCQQWGGPLMSVGSERYTLEGEAQVSVYRSSDWANRAFCRVCGSNLWYEFLPTGSRSFPAGLFDLPAGFALHEQIFIDEKPAWYDLAPETRVKTSHQVIAEAKAAGFSFD